MTRAPSVCSTPGCPEIVERTGLCSACRAKAAKRRRRSSGNTYDARWRRRRATYLASHKSCECDDCKILPEVARPVATDVHHVHGVVDGHRETDEELKAYAHGHHSRQTARQQPGGFAAFKKRDRLRAGRV